MKIDLCNKNKLTLSTIVKAMVKASETMLRSRLIHTALVVVAIGIAFLIASLTVIISITSNNRYH